MKKKTLLYGFSIFAMFFGSGNLVYPLQVGVEDPSNWLYGYLGFFCSGIILPFCGVFVIKLYKGDYNAFFAEAGGIAKVAIPLVTLSLLGSFGVIPRCITVAHGGFEYAYPHTSLVLFSIMFCGLCYIFCLKDQIMFKILGQVLTPILLGFLVLLIVVGVFDAVSNPDIYLSYLEHSKVITSSLLSKDENHSAIDVFFSGFVIGYNTMDLLAAYFFSALIFKEIEKIIPEQVGKSVIKAALKPSVIGMLMLALVYFGFVYLGATYSYLVKGVSAEMILPAISTSVLGRYGSLIISIIIIFACLTTAVALSQIYAKYLCKLFKVKDKNYPGVLAAITIISFFVSTLDFSGIAAILGPVLSICYPALIMLTLMSIIVSGHKVMKTIGFYGMILIVIFMDFI